MYLLGTCQELLVSKMSFMKTKKTYRESRSWLVMVKSRLNKGTEKPGGSCNAAEDARRKRLRNFLASISEPIELFFPQVHESRVFLFNAWISDVPRQSTQHHVFKEG
jgi:hypothetical protein